jgi:hypothetical protein
MAEFVKSREQQIWIAAAFVAVVLDFAGIKFLDSTPLPQFMRTCLTIGVVAFIAAQFSLLALWCVFGPHALLVRSVSALLSAACIVVAIRLPFGYEWHRFADYLASMLSSLPALALGATALLWPFRVFRGWRVGFQGDLTVSLVSQQFQLRDLFIVTGLVAFALAALRLGSVDTNARDSGQLDWVQLSGVGTFLAVVGLLSVMPPLWVAFQVNNWIAGLALLGGYAIILTCLDVAMMGPFGFFVGGPSANAIFITFFAQFCWLAASFGVLRVARHRGCILVRPRCKPRAAIVSDVSFTPE